MQQITIYEKFLKQSDTKRQQGTAYERFVCDYLSHSPEYSYLYDVQPWNEWEHKDGADTGIDLVARLMDTDGYVAIQCKCYQPTHRVTKADIDSFFEASGRQYGTKKNIRFELRLIITTAHDWSEHAEKAVNNPLITCRKIYLNPDTPIEIDTKSRKPAPPKRNLHEYQQCAIECVLEGLKQHDRGKLIMACGTGKTFTALRLAELYTHRNHGVVLFMVPSLSLMSQTIAEWTKFAENKFDFFCVCSDTTVNNRKKSEDDYTDLSPSELQVPTTDGSVLHKYFAKRRKQNPDRMAVVFSTYQSVGAISEAQKIHGFPAFDLIICDEAHRTTGVTLAGDDESNFVQIHKNENVKGKKRLYMTATPRIYRPDAREKAKAVEATLCSMDDEAVYGPELFRFGFGQAVTAGLLSDYRVMVLAVSTEYVTAAYQDQLATENSELAIQDAAKIIGCWNGLQKHTVKNEDEIKDEGFMRRAVAFAGNIKNSKHVKTMFEQVINGYLDKHPEHADDWLKVQVEHVDGAMSAFTRAGKIDWLKQADEPNVCRILTNARCLSEGVDVPALDAVMFLSPRKSEIDVVQAVGRVMRKAEGKQYGYIILPIAVPIGMTPEEALGDNKNYQVVWQVLQALRAHDERFNAMINTIELNNARPPQVQLIGIDATNDGKTGGGDGPGEAVQQPTIPGIFDNLEGWRDAIYARMVQRCGDRRYWEQWAADVAKIAEAHIRQIQKLLQTGQPRIRDEFAKFLQSLRNNLNPSVSQDDAVEMLAQHLITKPVFDALFSGYSFAEHNPVSKAMQHMIDALDTHTLTDEHESLKRFYDSVRNRAQGVDNAAGKQKIITELYEKFFKIAFTKTSEKLGIVYTPVQVVDFIIRSADVALQKHFDGLSISDKNVHILDPFTGTGTFMVRLLQSGLIRPADLVRKYTHELHANEIVLLAYYIAAINIEQTYHELIGEQENEYSPFAGIVLTDTFQMTKDATALFPFLQENSQRVKDQNNQPIRIIIGNPPYSVGQANQNDNNQNVKYPELDSRIEQTYAEHSTAMFKKTVYDSYIRAIRWASDRIQDRGLICFVTNGSFIDGNSADGLRKCLMDEFSCIYCLNLRGNQRTSGELSRKEGGKIFGSGSRTPVAVTVLVKTPKPEGTPAQLFYHDIGDYLSREEKLQIVETFQSIGNVPWEELTPDANNDWIHLRDNLFETFLPMGNKKNRAETVLFSTYSSGVKTNRDAWAYHFSKKALQANMTRMIEFYNRQVKDYQELCRGLTPKEYPDPDSFISTDSTRISWTRGLKNDLSKHRTFSFEPQSLRRCMYRPYVCDMLYFHRNFNDMIYQIPKLFPTPDAKNLVIGVCGIGSTKDFSALMTDVTPDIQLQFNGQFFPLYYYEESEEQPDLFSEASSGGGLVRREAITGEALGAFRRQYEDSSITKEDVFYYVYGILHSPEYKTRWSSDLKKSLPRIPFARDFRAFSKAGRELAKWHLHYETVEPYKVTLEVKIPAGSRRVEQMRFVKTNGEKDKTGIVYNDNITLRDIPLTAYDYLVNGKSAVEWIMERYCDSTDKDSGIRNDANEWAPDDPEYILTLLRRVIRVSVESARIVAALPTLGI